MRLAFFVLRRAASTRVPRVGDGVLASADFAEAQKNRRLANPLKDCPARSVYRSPITRYHGLGPGVGRGLGVGPERGVGVGLGVTVGVALGVVVGVAVGVAVGVGVGPPIGDTRTK